MSEAVLPYALFLVGSLVTTSVTYFLKNKKNYKNAKTAIYFMLEQAIKNVDYEKIAEAGLKLQKFDERFADPLTGLPVKKTLEKLFNKTRLPKLDGTLKLFGIPKEVITDAILVKEFFEKKVEKVSAELESIEEEEKTETEALSVHSLALEKIKRRTLAQNNATRAMIDTFSLTDAISNIHLEYAKYIETLFKEQTTLEKREEARKMLLSQLEKNKPKQLVMNV